MKKTIVVIMTIILVTLTTSSWAMQASWYSKADLIRDGQDKITHFIMANGREFKDEGLTCASWDWKLGTSVRVTNNENGKSIVVVVTDRTSRRFKGKRIDLSKYAFARIADLKQGLAQVSVEEIK